MKLKNYLLYYLINTNLATYDLLIKNKNFINRIMKRNIILYGQNYTLIGFITQPYPNHFISYFDCYNKEYQTNFKQWFKYDDMFGKIEKINNDVIALDNIMDTEGLSLFIYLKEK